MNNETRQPVPSGTQDEREREIRSKAIDNDHRYLLSLLDAERKRVQELEGALKRLIECPAMIYTSFSGNPDIEQRVHKQCICCTAHKGQPHIEGCHIAEAESLLAKEQTK